MIRIYQPDRGAMSVSVYQAMRQTVSRPAVGTTELDSLERSRRRAFGEITNEAVVGVDRRAQNGKQKGTKNKVKPAIEHLRAALAHWATDKHGDKPKAEKLSLSAAAVAHGVEPNDAKRASKKLGLMDLSLVDALGKIQEYEWKAAGNPDLINRKFLSEDDEEVLVGIIVTYSEMGFPFDEEGALALIHDIKVKKKEPVDSFTGADVKCTRGLMQKIYQRHPRLRKYKTSVIDPLRAKSATVKARPEVPVKCNFTRRGEGGGPRGAGGERTERRRAGGEETGAGAGGEPGAA